MAARTQPSTEITHPLELQARAATSIQAWPGYRFGLHDGQSEAASSYFGGERTDGQGMAIVPLEMPGYEETGQPMEMTVITRLSDGSARPVERQLKVPVQPAGPVIGIRPEFVSIGKNGIEAKVRKISDVGRHSVVDAMIDDLSVSAIIDGPPPEQGETVKLDFNPKQTRLYMDGWLATEAGAAA